MDTPFLRARDIMTPHPCVVDAELTLGDAADRMAANDVHHLLVEVDHEIVGVVRDSDVSLALSLAHRRERAPVAVAVMPGVSRCETYEPLSRVAAVLETSVTGCAAVYERGDLVGVVTSADLIHALREVLAGRPLRRPPHVHHEVPAPTTRPVVTHEVHTSDIVRSHGAGPNRGPHLT